MKNIKSKITKHKVKLYSKCTFCSKDKIEINQLFTGMFENF